MKTRSLAPFCLLPLFTLSIACSSGLDTPTPTETEGGHLDQLRARAGGKGDVGAEDGVPVKWYEGEETSGLLIYGDSARILRKELLQYADRGHSILPEVDEELGLVQADGVTCLLDADGCSITGTDIDEYNEFDGGFNYVSVSATESLPGCQTVMTILSSAENVFGYEDEDGTHYSLGTLTAFNPGGEVMCGVVWGAGVEMEQIHPNARLTLDSKELTLGGEVARGFDRLISDGDQYGCRSLGLIGVTCDLGVAEDASILLDTLSFSGAASGNYEGDEVSAAERMYMVLREHNGESDFPRTLRVNRFQCEYSASKEVFTCFVVLPFDATELL